MFFAFIPKELLFNEAYSGGSIPSISEDGARALNAGMDPSISRSIEWIKNLRDSTTIIVAPCSGRGIVRDWGL